MPTVMLTAKSVPVLRAREDGGRIDYWDEKATGLVLRVTSKARTYCVWYRVSGAARRLTLTPAEEISLADARARASAIRDQARTGVDAVVLKRTAAAEAQKAMLVGETFADLTARYLESAARGDGMKRGEALAPRTVAEYRRILNLSSTTLSHEISGKSAAFAGNGESPGGLQNLYSAGQIRSPPPTSRD
jgi:hypothetical protein